MEKGDEQNEEAKICALCKWNRSITHNFHCSNPLQANSDLKNATKYNDSCGLFEEKEERRTMYDFWDQEIKHA